MFVLLLSIVGCRMLKPPAPQLEGAYAAKGTNSNGSPYEGLVVIRKHSDGLYMVKWQIGPTNYSGIGELKEDTLSVDWGSGSPVIYHLEPDGSLKGTWDKGAATENLTP